MFFEYFCARNSVSMWSFPLAAIVLTLRKLPITSDSKEQRKDAQPGLKTCDRQLTRDQSNSKVGFMSIRSCTNHERQVLMF